MNVFDELEWRGLIADCTDQAELVKRLGAGPITLYCGFDPTADSLHVGNLVPLLALRRFQSFGHHPIAVAGGATGLIGDPSGKTDERQLLTRELLAANIASVKAQLSRLLDFKAERNPARLVDNADWTASVSFLDFLRDIGKHFSVNMMVAKESVRARMEDRESGISYTEFSYMLLQAFDFYHLCQTGNCELQIGGSDQWGNITAGIDLCRKKLGKTVYGLTLPLITTASGSKFGKTAAGAVWLDRNKTSPYQFYQFWIRTDDRDVIRYLKYFTFGDEDPAYRQEQIRWLENEHKQRPESRRAHEALARFMTRLVHGEDAMNEAVRASEVLFGGSVLGVSEATLEEISEEMPERRVEGSRFEGQGAGLLDLLVEAGLCSSKGQARKDIEAGAIHVNNVRETHVRRSVIAADLLYGKKLMLRKGKRNYCMIQVVERKTYRITDEERRDLFLTEPEMARRFGGLPGAGGFQSLLHHLQTRCDQETGDLILDSEDMRRIRRYAFEMGHGGFQAHLLAIFRRTLGDDLRGG